MSHDCPTCDRDDFDTERAMKVHHSRSHGESLRGTTTCNECGDEFAIEDPTKPNNYCSRECVHESKRDRVELICENCDDEFEVPKSAGDRRFCSRDCQLDSVGSVTLTSCAMCNRRFSHSESKERKYCCSTCYAEQKCDRPRPTDVESILWLLYVYEGYDTVETYRRQRAVLGFDDCLEQKEVRDRLDEMGVKQDYNPARWTLLKTDPDAIGQSKPTGDESYKQFYQEA